MCEEHNYRSFFETLGVYVHIYMYTHINQYISIYNALSGLNMPLCHAIYELYTAITRSWSYYRVYFTLFRNFRSHSWITNIMMGSYEDMEHIIEKNDQIDDISVGDSSLVCFMT